MKLAFVGRFQPFHKGHKKVYERFSKDHDVVIVLANPDTRTRDNPLTVEERKSIIESCVQTEIFVQEEFPESDERWARELVDATGIDGVITRNDWTRKAVENYTDLEILEQEMHNRQMFSGSEVRTRIRSGDEWRYLVPDCALELVDRHSEKIAETGIDYEFEPGWKPENAKN